MRWLARETAADAALKNAVSPLSEVLAVDWPGADLASALCSYAPAEPECPAVPESAGVENDASDWLATVSSVCIRWIAGLAVVSSVRSSFNLSGKLLAFLSG